MEQDLVILLTDYLRSARQVAADLCHTFSTSDLLASVNARKIPRPGTYHGFGGGQYFFHGVSCRIETVEIEIDFDFGRNASISGADPWKLFNYAVAPVNGYRWPPDRLAFNQHIENLLRDEHLHRSYSPQSPLLLLPADSSEIRK